MPDRDDTPHDAGPIALDGNWAIVVDATPGRGSILLQRRGASRAELEIEILITEAGPVVRARAAALEIETPNAIIARCREFRVEAEEGISLVSGGAIEQRAATTARTEAAQVQVEATRGNVVLQANDDVQALGEQILLNCDRDPPLPAWLPTRIPREAAPAPALSRADAAGDLSLFAEVDGSASDGSSDAK